VDDFNSLAGRVLARCPNVGLTLAQQFVNEAWRQLQSRREWSWRRSSGVFAPPDQYTLGGVTTNVSGGAPTQITGVGTTWTAAMVGRQIRIGGLLYPYYTIAGYLSPTSLILDQPWAGPDVTAAAYQMLQCYYSVPQDFGYWYAVVSIKDGYRLHTTLTESDLAMADPQRNASGQSYAVAFRDYTQNYNGVINPAMPLQVSASNPVATTTTGFNYPAPATYLIKIVGAGATGAATFQWARLGGSGLSLATLTDTTAIDLSEGVQVYFPAGANWTNGDCWVINCTPLTTSGVPRFEFWPAPTYSAYLYPYQYIKKEYDLTPDQPQLPPPVANRGEILIEMSLEKCAEFPGEDADHRNIYHDLKQAAYHHNKWLDMLVDLDRNDEEVGNSNIDYQTYPLYPSPWMDGSWQQRHSVFFNG
jgi:hypothetical protein